MFAAHNQVSKYLPVLRGDEGRPPLIAAAGAGVDLELNTEFYRSDSTDFSFPSLANCSLMCMEGWVKWDDFDAQAYESSHGFQGVSNG